MPLNHIHELNMPIPPQPALNIAAPQALDLLLSRRSAKARFLAAPGPSAEELTRILTAAARVPDHGKLAPWRFIVFEGEARARFGQMLVEALRETETPSAEREAQEAGRFLSAPLVVGVVSRARPGLPIPEWEQILSAGAVCQNLLIAAHALGYVAVWLTGWFAYHPKVLQRLGLAAGERIAGFIHIGTGTAPVEERPRPDLNAIVARY
jgi:nitroreductase